ncbi:cytochrome P450 78A3 [Populus alba]|uniref:Cytochrome P450 78A3-like n=1 Tax=Populus alba x Populus x berolinensis TaxID=444605 RepID=A0AAD6LSQ8_9ROSI|nr:cytochrome P450 78A3-like [Populus alba]KAJ6972582.1 cytochrome P450 78A3-like [Populus alba x Populus x berolinensis]
MRTDIESFWIFALASKCRAFTQENIAWSLLIIGLAWIVVTLIYWAYPGGPAWGKYKLKNTSFTISNAIPGSRGLPVTGSMKLMTSLAHHKIAAAAAACKARRLMAFSLGDTRVIVTCNPDVAKEILNSSVFADRPVKESAYSLMFNRAIGFAPYGVYWRTLRKIASTHLFCPKQIKAAESQRLQIASQMVSTFSDREKSSFSVRGVLKRASLNNMMCSVFGREYKLDSFNNEVEELRALVEEGYDLLGTLNWSDHLPWLADFDPQKIRFRCSNLVPKVNRFVSRIIAEHRALPRSENPDFVDVLLSLQGHDKLSDSDMIAVLWEMIFRGTDTVAVLIEWILARMVLHPDVQSKVHDELYKVVGRSRVVAESDITAMVHLQAVVKEVLRLHPPGPLLSWARLAITDTTIDGYHVPKGTTAMVNMWAISRDPEFWEDPLEFKPERFVVTKEDALEFSVLGSDLRLAPFGSGRRTCPGKTLGITTVTFWVASLLHEYEWVPGDENNVDLSEVLRLSCEMANPLTVKVRPRRSFHNPPVLGVQRTTS